MVKDAPLVALVQKSLDRISGHRPSGEQHPPSN